MIGIKLHHRPDNRRGAPKLQFHQFSTGSWHRSAADYYVEFDKILTARATCTDCCGDNVVAVILDGEKEGDWKSDYVFLVEWKIGRITQASSLTIQRHQCPDFANQLRKAEPRTYGTMVTFLSSDTLVFSLRNAFALQICKLTRAGNDSTPILQTICSLQLPGLFSGKKIADLRLAQPSPLSGNRTSSTEHSLSSFPFKSDPEDDILAFEVFFGDDHGRRVIFIARRRTLLSLASPTGSDASMSPYTKAWEDWGPRTTHWLELDPVKDSMSLVGSRCVLVKYSHLRKYFVLDLRDFNPYRVRARRAHSSSNSSSSNNNKYKNGNSKAVKTAGITAQAILSAEACFEEDVVSELPFVSTRKENVGSRVFVGDEWMAEILVRSIPLFLVCFLRLGSNWWHRAYICDRQLDRDIQAQVIHFRTITPPAEV